MRWSSSTFTGAALTEPCSMSTFVTSECTLSPTCSPHVAYHSCSPPGTTWPLYLWHMPGCRAAKSPLTSESSCACFYHDADFGVSEFDRLGEMCTEFGLTIVLHVLTKAFLGCRSFGCKCGSGERGVPPQ